MLKVVKILSIIVLLVIGFSRCSSDSECGYRPDDVSQLVDIEILRLEDELLNITDPQELVDFMNREPIIAEFFLRQAEYPSLEIMVSELLNRFSNPYIDSLESEMDRIYSDLEWLESDLEDAFNLVKYYYPDFEPPVVKTVATGFDYDLFVSDSLIVIGLDYYMGPEAKYRPQGTYNYILKRYDQKYIVPSIMLLYGISADYNKYQPEDQSILSDMVSYGKSFYFAKRMVPCTSDSVLIWYSDKEFEGTVANRATVWSHFIDNNLLFETSHLVKRKYLEERPKTFEIGPDCPPRIATWVGWEIVNKYMKDHPEVSLQQLMEMADARYIFEQTRYRPE